MTTLTMMVRDPVSQHWECPRCGWRMGENDLLSSMIKTSECNCIGVGTPEGYFKQTAAPPLPDWTDPSEYWEREDL